MLTNTRRVQVLDRFTQLMDAYWDNELGWSEEHYRAIFDAHSEVYHRLHETTPSLFRELQSRIIKDLETVFTPIPSVLKQWQSFPLPVKLGYTVMIIDKMNYNGNYFDELHSTAKRFALRCSVWTKEPKYSDRLQPLELGN